MSYNVQGVHAKLSFLNFYTQLLTNFSNNLPIFDLYQVEETISQLFHTMCPRIFSMTASQGRLTFLTALTFPPQILENRHYKWGAAR